MPIHHTSPLPAAFAATSAAWPDPVRQIFAEVRALFLDVAEQAEIGPLEESLKWGQLAWRPRKPRTGSALRVNWSAQDPSHITAYVDCKTDLASQMQTRFPDLPGNDGRRAIRFDLAPTNTEAMAQLAYLTFTYHRSKRGSAR